MLMSMLCLFIMLKVVRRPIVPLNTAATTRLGSNGDGIVGEDWCGTGCQSSEYCYGICNYCSADTGSCGEYHITLLSMVALCINYHLN